MKIEKIRQLVKLLEDSSVSEIEIKYFGGRSIRVSKNDSQETQVTTGAQAQTQRAQPTQQKKVQPTQQQPTSGQKTGEQPKSAEKEEPSETAEEGESESGLKEIESPIVGTFYRAPSPDEAPFVKEGEHISVGQVVCIVEAMKVMNEIKSETSGVVKEICVDDSEPVEYGQTLFKIEEE